MKKQIQKIKAAISKRYHRYHIWQEYHFGHTAAGAVIAAVLLIAVMAAILIADMFAWSWVLFTLVLLISGGIAAAVNFLLGWLAGRIFKNNGYHVLSFMEIAVIFYSLAYIGSVGNSRFTAVLMVIIGAPAYYFLGKALWAILVNKRDTRTIILTISAGLLVVTGITALALSEGFEDTYVETYLSLNEQVAERETVSGFAAAMEPGEYLVGTLEYGPEEEIAAGTVDLSPFAVQPDGLEGLYHKYIKVYELDQVPIAGKIWYPEGKSNCPVLFFAHGNHSILTKSYLGYEYLGQYLASHGYVMVSVDQNILNGLSHENDARAILLLENMKKLMAFNRVPGHLLHGLMDEQNAAIGGHSRGGEMAAVAYLFNDYEYYPENGNILFDYHFNIHSIIAVAPSVNQYQPASHAVELTDVNYLLVQGANDQDISYFMGNIQYENVAFTAESTVSGDYIKSSLYIAGANHSQFNSEWGKYDMPAVYHTFHNVANFMEEEEQQDILKIFTKVFLDLTLGQETEYADLLTDYGRYAGDLPQTPYIQQYATSDSICVANFEEDADLATGTQAEVKIQAENVSEWSEEMLYFSTQADTVARDNHGLRLRWGRANADEKKAEVSFMMPSCDITGKSIRFDICDMDEELVEAEDYRTLHCRVMLTDQWGNTAVLESGEIITVYQAFPVRLSKLQYLIQENEYKHHFQTVALPAALFVPDSAEFDMTKIKKITISFPNRNAGNVCLDNIAIGG